MLQENLQKNRALRLGEIYSSINQMAGGQKNIKKYPLLSEMVEYQEIVDLQKTIIETEKQINNKIKQVLNSISRFERNDPVTIAYEEIFNKKTIYQHKIANDDLKKDFDNRINLKIPPGYKDGSKPQNAEGDLIIWHSILELGEQFKENLVFISQDGKPDWQYNVNKKPFQPRYELVDEYRRISTGKSFHIAPLSQLLEILDTPKATVNRIEWLEHLNLKSERAISLSIDNSLDAQVSEMKKWFLSNYEIPENSLPYESKEGGFIYIWGGPYYLDEVLHETFDGEASEHLVDLCIEEIEAEYGNVEWSGTPDNESVWVSVNVDYETSNNAGATGMFQVVDIEDEAGNSLAKHIDQGQHYHNLDELLKELSIKLGIEVNGEIT